MDEDDGFEIQHHEKNIISLESESEGEAKVEDLANKDKEKHQSQPVENSDHNIPLANLKKDNENFQASMFNSNPMDKAEIRRKALDLLQLTRQQTIYR